MSTINNNTPESNEWPQQVVGAYLIIVFHGSRNLSMNHLKCRSCFAYYMLFIHKSRTKALFDRTSVYLLSRRGNWGIPSTKCLLLIPHLHYFTRNLPVQERVRDLWQYSLSRSEIFPEIYNFMWRHKNLRHHIRQQPANPLVIDFPRFSLVAVLIRCGSELWLLKRMFNK